MEISKSPPNIILRGCIYSKDALEYIHTSIIEHKGKPPTRDEEISISNTSSVKPARIIRWSWGIQLWAAPFRNRSDKWWDCLLKTLSARSVAFPDGIKIILICAADTLPSQTQMVLRAHLEDDYRTSRYILTTASDTFMERSLESRCVVMVSKKNEWDKTFLHLLDPEDSKNPPIVAWEQLKNAWLSDIPAYRILDSLFEPYVKSISRETEDDLRKMSVIAWCRYADLLKTCYQEITVLRKGWEWIQKHHKMRHVKEKLRGKS